MANALVMSAAAVAAFLLGLLGWLYNRLVAYRNECENAWAQIEVQLKRRSDLIPKLVDTVKGAMKYEKETLEAVTRARQQALDAGTGPQGARLDAEAGLGGALKRLLAVVEAYPDLKANENTMALQDEITATENKIAFSRTYFNDITANYNTLVEQFPQVLFAAPLGFKRRPLFKD